MINPIKFLILFGKKKAELAPHEETVKLDIANVSASFDAYEITTYSYNAYPQETINMGVTLSSASFSISEVV